MPDEIGRRVETRGNVKMYDFIVTFRAEVPFKLIVDIKMLVYCKDN